MCDAQPVLNIVGDLVALGPWEREHGPAYKRWINDYATTRTYEPLPGPWPSDRIDGEYEGFFNNRNHVLFAIYDRETLKLIGQTLLYKVDHVNRIAEFGIMIGEPEYRSQGFGTEATRLLLDRAFLALGLSNVILRVFEYNLAGIRAYEKAGFKRMGVRRKSKLMGGKLWDTVYMEALAGEFHSPVLGKILVPDELK